VPKFLQKFWQEKEIFNILKYMGCARFQDLTARFTTRANDSHAAPDLDFHYFKLYLNIL
jgi:hypothetical protein